MSVSKKVSTTTLPFLAMAVNITNTIAKFVQCSFRCGSSYPTWDLSKTAEQTSEKGRLGSPCQGIDELQDCGIILLNFEVL